MTALKLGPKITLSVKIELKLDEKVIWYGCRGGCLCQQTAQQYIFVCGQFQMFNFGCLLLKLLIYFLKTESIWGGAAGVKKI